MVSITSLRKNPHFRFLTFQEKNTVQWLLTKPLEQSLYLPRPTEFYRPKKPVVSYRKQGMLHKVCLILGLDPSSLCLPPLQKKMKPLPTIIPNLRKEKRKELINERMQKVDLEIEEWRRLKSKKKDFY